MAHNVIYDYWMQVLSAEAFTLLSCVIRRTWGWQQQEAEISLGEFKHDLGVEEDNQVYRPLRELHYLGALVESSKKGKRNKKGYFIPAHALSTDRVSVVRDGKRYITTDTGSEVLLPPRQMYSRPLVSSSTVYGSVVTWRQVACETNQEAARRDSKREAKDSLKTIKNKDKDIPPSAGAPVVAPVVEEEDGLEGEEMRGESALLVLADRLFEAEKNQYPAKDWYRIKRKFVEEARAMLASPAASVESASVTLQSERATPASERSAPPEAITQAQARVKRAQDALDTLRTSRMLKYAGHSKDWWRLELQTAQAELETLWTNPPEQPRLRAVK